MGGGIVFSFLKISPMVIVHQVQWPSFFYTLTRYWSAGFTCYLSLPKVCCVDVIWLCYRPKRDYTDLSSWRNWIFGSTFPPLVTLFLNLPSRLPPSRCLIGGRLGVRQWLQWNTADGSLRFRGCTRTGVNLAPQYLTANPNPAVWSSSLRHTRWETKRPLPAKSLRSQNLEI